jgi:hypothetical protein
MECIRIACCACHKSHGVPMTDVTATDVAPRAKKVPEVYFSLAGWSNLPQ